MRNFLEFPGNSRNIQFCSRCSSRARKLCFLLLLAFGNDTTKSANIVHVLLQAQCSTFQRENFYLLIYQALGIRLMFRFLFIRGFCFRVNFEHSRLVELLNLAF